MMDSMDDYCNNLRGCCNRQTSAAMSEYFFGIFYFISFSLVQAIFNRTLMSSNTITDTLLY